MIDLLRREDGGPVPRNGYTTCMASFFSRSSSDDQARAVPVRKGITMSDRVRTSVVESVDIIGVPVCAHEQTDGVAQRVNGLGTGSVTSDKSLWGCITVVTDTLLSISAALNHRLAYFLKSMFFIHRCTP
jgi:hypothetical protein